MERLDHFVIHIDKQSETIAQFKATLPALGFPFKPEWGKGNRGFKAANLWIGQQYFEIIRILKTDGGGWPPYWVQKYKQGVRGIYCIFLATDRLNEIRHTLNIQGIKFQGPERTSFRWLFFKKTLPWRYILLPEIPGTDIQIGFIQYDADAEEKFAAYMVPNASKNGINGINLARVDLPFSNETLSFLKKPFPDLQMKENQAIVQLFAGKLVFRDQDQVSVTLQASSINPDYSDASFMIENVCVETVYAGEDLNEVSARRN